MRRSISVIAGTLHGNRGAQGMVESVVGHVRADAPDATISLFSYYPHEDRRVLTDPSVSVYSCTPLTLVLRLLPLSLLFGLARRVLGRRALRLAPRDVRDLGESDVLACVAGVSFIDGREKFLPFNVLTILPALLLGVPVVKLPQAVGPFSSPVNRLAARLVLPRVRMVWARGAATYDHLVASGIDGVRFAQADDVAFAHADDHSLTEEGTEVARQVVDAADGARLAGRTVVGICPSSVVAAQSAREDGAYEQFLVELVSTLAAAGHQVVLFPNATRDGDDDERNNDLPLIRRTLDALDLTGDGLAPIALDADVDAVRIRVVIAACDVVVVSRFHAMVGALGLTVPTIVLGWSHKYREVMDRFGQADRVLDWRQATAGGVAELVRTALDDRDAIVAQLASALPAVRASALTPLSTLLAPDHHATTSRA